MEVENIKNKNQLHIRVKELRKRTAIAMVMAVCLLCGCSYGTYKTEQPDKTVQAEKDYNILLPGTYDSKDTAIFVSKNEDDKTITFLNLDKSKKYTLNYNGTTKFYDKYDEALALSQVREGSIVDVTFLKNSKRLNTLQLSKKAWTNSGVRQFEINENKRNIRIGSDTYKYSDDLIVVQDKQQMEIMDINTVDILDFNGIGTSIYSVQIQKGHGYLRLTGDEYVIGGWIEVGQSLIQEITEGMLLTVPEGTYDVVVSNKNYNVVEKVTINRNEETILDLSKIEGVQPKKGTVLFSVTPANAKVFVDGTEVDISAPVELDYGIHQLMAKAEGYVTSTSYLKVGEASAGINIVLDEDDSTDKSDTEDKDNNDNNDNNTVSDNTSEDPTDGDKNSEASVSDNNNESGNQDNQPDNSTASDYYKVYIDNPKDVEVYIDGNYVGITPVSFKKVSGIHVVTLRKSGYETRSYTINVDSEKRDASYSFVNLTADE